jgi:hypothetical protein
MRRILTGPALTVTVLVPHLAAAGADAATGGEPMTGPVPGPLALSGIACVWPALSPAMARLAAALTRPG